jgi:DUF1680 family protein
MRPQPAPLAAPRPVDLDRVRIAGGLLGERQRANRSGALPAIERFLRETGRWDAYRWRPGMPQQPHWFGDSDIAKFIEAACYELAREPDARLARDLDALVADMASSQEADGYLNPYFQRVEPQGRWRRLISSHELYCAGHLIEAAIARDQALGQGDLLAVALRQAACIEREFGAGAGQVRGYDGHPEIELALVRLARHTGDERWRRLARFFVDERGLQPNFLEPQIGSDTWTTDLSIVQAHQPVREQTRVVGHAVRAFYLYAGMADLARDDGDEGLGRACRALWEHATSRCMYLTGGFGSTARHEGFTRDWHLPSESAYCETCAAAAFVMWCARMLALDGDGRYADELERSLYNNLLAGTALDGATFFYVNPLADGGLHRRHNQHGCYCCPPNWARLVASLGAYAFGEDDSGAWVHLYVQGSARLRTGGGELGLRIDTAYPWDGAVAITVDAAAPLTTALRLRIPAWCRTWRVRVNGEAVTPALARGYAVLQRAWEPGDRVELELELAPRRVHANPAIDAERGRVALMRGPLVYCLEGCDNGAGLDHLTLPRSAAVGARRAPQLLGGVTVLECEALAERAEGALYADQPFAAPASERRRITAIPYFAWQNRQAGEMRVWIREADG